MDINCEINLIDLFEFLDEYCGNEFKFKSLNELANNFYLLGNSFEKFAEEIRLSLPNVMLTKVDTPTAKAMGFLFLRPLHCRKDFSFT